MNQINIPGADDACIAAQKNEMFKYKSQVEYPYTIILITYTLVLFSSYPESKTYIKCQSLTTISFLISENTYQTLATLEKARLQTDDNKLHSRTGMLPDVVLNLLNIGIVKRSINLVQNEERTGLIGVNSEEES
jgi:hypothetical protein